MKKYIRIKDGYIFKAKEDLGKYVVVVDINGDQIELTAITDQSNILKESNNLEELCDEFVVCHNGKTICQFARNVWGYEQIKYLGTSNDFYGAIWTDKGLIYVAKMNEKGDLELL